MRFAVPQFLWLLLLGPILVGFFWWSWKVRRRLMTQFIHSRLLNGLLSDFSPARQKIRAGLLVTAVLLAAVALARPQWGFHLEEVKQRGLDIVVAMDTSRSMLAADVAPNRLQRAKLEAVALQQLCRADRLGLVAFAGTAFLQCPLSLDDDAFRQGLDALDVNIIPQGGTALAEAIRTALGAFKQKTDNHKVLVLFSDGEDHDGQAVEAARDAAKDGLRIFTVGVGTPNGELLATVDEQGRRSFVKDSDGNVVKSHLNEALMQEIATVANGFYLPLSGAKTMDTLYQRGLAPLPRTESESKTVRQYYERFPWFLAPAIVLLLLEMFIADAKPGARFRNQGAKTASLTAALLLALMPVGSLPAHAASPSKMNVQSSSDESARQELKREREERLRQRALEKEIQDYDRRIKKHPEDARLHYNKGTFQYELKDYSAAEKELKQALSTPDLKLQERAYYNLGNTHYRQGEEIAEPQKKMAGWQEAVSSFESALKLDPKDEDARFNLEVVKKKLEELKQQQQQNQDKDKDKDNDKDKDKQDQQKDQQKNDKQNDQQKKDDQQDQKQDQKQDQQKQQQQQDQKQQDQSQQQQQEQKQEGDKQEQPSEAQQGEKKEGDPNQDATKPMKMMQMTPEQARQLLDAQRAEEKPMPFWRLLRTNRVERVLKDW